MIIPNILFEPFTKIARLTREAIITEKIDGTSASVYIDADGDVHAASRTKWITPTDDNYGFAAWVQCHAEQLRTLGLGIHRGEWWGSGIQRGYGLAKGEKRLSLFNVARWCLYGQTPQRMSTADPRIEKYQDVLPPCVGLVPVLYRGLFTTEACSTALERMRTLGSAAAPGFMKPEGIVCFHVAANIGLKKTLDKDDEPKSASVGA